MQNYNVPSVAMFSQDGIGWFQAVQNWCISVLLAPIWSKNPSICGLFVSK
jgi:hypothetical protein